MGADDRRDEAAKIMIRVGRSGALNPWALMEPVEVGGVTVTRATLHNEEDINRKRSARAHRHRPACGRRDPEIVGPAGGVDQPGTKVSGCRRVAALGHRDGQAGGRGHASLSEP